ncbi:unnamed protein product [Eruca vesicaria subsp. sativa]|uniref:Uncharacterized protein n=1 Tax=Eruca vesicaria subsp. sativa TaxID=29727 RepID=A0ABC8JCQ5_ERUVS|nr:unnamed protein product [Eruca vesicaria subsp. sativa]
MGYLFGYSLYIWEGVGIVSPSCLMLYDRCFGSGRWRLIQLLRRRLLTPEGRSSLCFALPAFDYRSIVSFTWKAIVMGSLQIGMSRLWKFSGFRWLHVTDEISSMDDWRSPLMVV